MISDIIIMIREERKRTLRNTALVVLMSVLLFAIGCSREDSASVPTTEPTSIAATVLSPTATPPPPASTATPIPPTPAVTPTPIAPAATSVPPTPTATSAALPADLQLRLDRLSQQLDARRQQLHIPGMAIAVVKDDEVILVRGFGLADLENETPVTPETIFPIASATKAFTATLVGMLVDDGMMDWDDPVTEHITYFALNFDSEDENDQVTIRDMLSHQTGFPRMGVLIANGAVPREEVLLAATKAEPWVDLREKFYYSNVMYLAAGVAAGNAAGTDWDTLVTRRIFEPLGMNSSNTSVSQSQGDPRLSLGYQWDEDLQIHEHLPMRPVDNIGPAGAINSNVLDMAQWLRFQLSRGLYDSTRLLSDTQHRETWTTQIEIAPGTRYSLGWLLHDWQGQPVIEHGGSLGGFASQVALLPESNLGFVLLTNNFVTPLLQESINMVWEVLLGELEAEQGVIDYTPYLGEYMNEFGPLQNKQYNVLVRDGMLALEAVGEAVYDLKPPDEEGKWYFAVTDQAAVSFDRDDEGDVIALVIHQGGLDFEIPRFGVEIPPEIPLDDLQKYLGSYHSEDLGIDVTVIIQNNRLTIDAPGYAVYELHPPDREGMWVFRDDAELAVSFNESGSGIESMTMYQAGQESILPRIDVASDPLPPGAEIPPEIPLDELQKYLGTYHSEDLGIDVTVVVQNNRLAVDVPGQMVYALYPPDQEDKWVFRITDEIAVSFNESDAGIESMTMYQAGQEFNMPRLDIVIESLPTVDDILVLRDTDRRIVAREEMGTSLITGTTWVAQSGVEGTFSTYVSGIDRIRADTDYGKFGGTRTAVNGDRAWIESFGRFEELHGQHLEQAIQDHPAVSDNWGDFFDSIRVLSASELEGRNIYVVELQRGELPPTTVYVDAETGDVLMAEGTVLVKGGVGIPVVSRFEDFREVHGVRIPFRTISSNEVSGRVVVQIDSVQTNIDVSDEIFILRPPSED